MKIVIVGAGEVGFHIARRLSSEKKDVVVVDRNADAIRRVSENTDVQVVLGSGGSPVALEEAGIRQAEILLAVTDSDETNLLACLMTDCISPTTKKLARLRDADYDQYHEIFKEKSPHIDMIINPEIEVVKTIDKMMKVPGALEVWDFADGRIKLVGIKMDENTPITGLHLYEIPEKLQNKRILIASISRSDELIVPRGNDRLLKGDVVYFICEREKLTETLKIFNKYYEPVKYALIIGGGRIGLRLAKLLEEKSIHTKIIEKNPQRCQQLAELLENTVVLYGDGSDQRLLMEENIKDMDIVITLTNDEETNILTSLLSKRLGAKKVITKTSNFSYYPLLMTIGMEQAVNPRLSAINSILQHVRRGKILSAVSLKGEQAEVIEAVALPTSDIVGKPIKNISFPKAALITAIISDDQIIIPSGESIIKPDDRIIIFAKRQAVSKVEKSLSVKLEYF